MPETNNIAMEKTYVVCIQKLINIYDADTIIEHAAVGWEFRGVDDNCPTTLVADREFEVTTDRIKAYLKVLELCPNLVVLYCEEK